MPESTGMRTILAPGRIARAIAEAADSAYARADKIVAHEPMEWPLIGIEHKLALECVVNSVA
jgi:hypothetical protein